MTAEDVAIGYGHGHACKPGTNLLCLACTALADQWAWTKAHFGRRTALVPAASALNT